MKLGELSTFAFHLDRYFKMLDIPFACFEDAEESQEDIEKRLSNQLDLYSKEQQIRSIIIKKGVVI